MNTIRVILTVVAATIALCANSFEKPKLMLVPLTSDRAIVSIKNTYPTPLEFSIRTESGEEVYHKKSEEPVSSFKKIFDFEELANGKYTLNLKVDNKSLTREFEIEPEEIHIGTSKFRFDPYFVFVNDVLKFSYLNVDGEKLKLNIYGQGKLLFTSDLGSNVDVSSGYDLSGLEPGSYEVVLSSLENEFNYNLTK